MVHLEHNDTSGDSGIPDGLGITGLLNELLAAQERGSQENGLEDDNDDLQHESATSGPIGTEDEPEPEEQEVPTELALRQLHGEVDACLQSLGSWEAESRRRREELKRELEAKYGFSYDEALASLGGDEGLLSHNEGVASDDDFQLISAFSPQDRVPATFSVATLPEVGAARADSSMSNSMQDIEERRLAMLRAEVEDLKRRSAEADALYLADAQAAEVDDDDLSGAAHGLAAWCAELDDVLDFERLPDALQQVPSEANELQIIEETEQALERARNRAGRLEDSLGDAYARMEAEIGDLEKLLADCDLARASMTRSPTETAS